MESTRSANDGAYARSSATAGELVLERPATADAGERAASGTATWATLLFLTAIGAYLRFANLGALGLRGDEKYSSLSAKAILEHGIPELPSGMVYLRGSWLLYLMAWSTELFGQTELALRLPVALFGVATIPVAFLFGRALFGARAGLVVAALVAFSQWDVEMARTARMYGPFTLFYLLTVLGIWRYRVRDESLRGGLLCIALALVAVSLHQLGYTLALAFLFPVLVRGRIFAEPAKLVFPLAASATVAGAFVLWTGVVDYYRNLPAANAAAAEAENVADHAVGNVLGPLASALPELPLLEALWQRAPALAATFAVAALAGVLLFVGSRARRPRERAARSWSTALDAGLLFAIAACSALALFNVALLAAGLLAFRKRAGLAALGRPDVRFAVLLTAAAFAAWLAAGLWFDLLGLAAQGPAGAVAGTIRAMLDFPHFFVFWAYPNQWPLAAAVAAIGALWAFDRAARPQPDPAASFLLLAFLTPLVLNGLFDTQYQYFRYNVPFNTFFFAFIALGILNWSSVLGALRVAAPRGRTASVAGTAAAIALVAAVDLNPAAAFLVTSRNYTSAGAPYRWFGLASYPDYQGAARFVAAAAREQDLIIAYDSREYFDYIGRLDYWLRSARDEGQIYEEGGQARDIYLSTPLIADMAALRSVLRLPDRTKWVILSEMLLNSSLLSDDIKQFFRARQDHIAYIARDGQTYVYRFDGPDASTASAAAHDAAPD